MGLTGLPGPVGPTGMDGPKGESGYAGEPVSQARREFIVLYKIFLTCHCGKRLIPPHFFQTKRIHHIFLNLILIIPEHDKSLKPQFYFKKWKTPSICR